MKRVFVSGSTRGIGKAIAFDLAKAGFQVTLHGRMESPEALRSVQELREVYPGTQMVFFDVANRRLAAEVLQEDVEKNGAYYGVVINAGLSADAPLAGMNYDQWRDVLSVNLDGFYHILHPLLLPMIRLRKGGRVVGISSLSGVAGNRGQVNYSAAKAGLIGAVKALSRELASRQITVNCVAPGAIETPMISDDIRQSLLSDIPVRRLGMPEEVAHAVAYFFDDRASFTTGQVLGVNGGVV
jgi:3-oxoacyl-[acyl-carrier protein] reductase